MNAWPDDEKSEGTKVPGRAMRTLKASEPYKALEKAGEYEQCYELLVKKLHESA